MTTLGRIALGLYLVVVAWSAPAARGPDSGLSSSSPGVSSYLRPMPHPRGPGRPAPQSGRGTMQEIDMVINAAQNRARPRGASPMSDPMLVEMDMRLTDAQWAAIYGMDNTNSTFARIAIDGDNYRWTDAIIPYEIDSIFNTAQRKQLTDAMREWESLTCIRFVPRSTQSNYMRIISDADGCWSQVGMNGGKQELSINVNGCLYHSTIVHELGHAIGFHHEQTRPDRDEHLHIILDNTESGREYNFDKYEWGFVKNYGLKYDYWSVMHYGQWAFSRNGKRTIETLKDEYQEVIGTTPGASIRDVQTTLLMYGCAAHCDKSRCPAGTVISSDCKCWCSTGIPGNPVVEWDGTSECKGVNEDTDPCVNFVTECDAREQQGECDSNPSYMLKNCRRSCRICGPDPVCKDYDASCLQWALRGECETNPSFMNRHCRKSCYTCGERPRVCSADQSAELCASFAAQGDCEEYRDSMLERCPMACKVCPTAPGYECRNWHVECMQWKNFGRCSTEPDWMALHCPKACGQCTGGNIPDCKNYAVDANCDKWAKSGECAKNPSWMLVTCAKSCKTCGQDKACIDRLAQCGNWADSGYCQGPVDGPLLYFQCPTSCNHCTPESGTNTDTCRNYSPFCSEWAGEGRCDTDPDLMLWTCPRSCQICGPVTVCKNYNQKCTDWASSGECDANPGWMHKACAEACQTCPGSAQAASTTPTPTTTTTTPTTTTTTPTTTTTITTTTSKDDRDCKDIVGSNYCKKLINVHKYDCDTYAYWMGRNCAKSCRICGPTQICRNLNDNCVYWAGIGECTKNPGYMLKYCQAACGTCETTVTTTTTTEPTTTTVTAPKGGWTTEFDKTWCPDYIDTTKCERLSQEGKCESDRSFMFSNCAGTCNVCGSGADCKNFERQENDPQCENWARVGHCDNAPTFMKLYCRKACRVCT